ncbi:MAG: hypothetical protein NVSMB32_04340 [Actinomycetota bacterium]
MLKPDTARKVLGGIRAFNGCFALLAPRKFLKLLGGDPENNGAAVYAVRLFGVRTAYLGYQLLCQKGDTLEQAVHDAVYIHATDTAAALIGGLSGKLPKKAAFTGTLTSAGNTALSWVARGK